MTKEEYLQQIATATMFSIVGFEDVFKTRLSNTELVLTLPNDRELIIQVKPEESSD